MIPRTIVVTGASGFTGPFVVAALRRRYPASVIRCFVRASSRRDVLQRAGAEFAVGDLRDLPSLRSAFAGADTLVNVASLGFDWIDPLFEAINTSGLHRGVFVSTTAILTRLPARSRPIRERGEALVQSSRLSWTIIRPTMIYGTPDDRNVARLIRFVLKYPLIPVIAPHALQQPIHVEDVASAVSASVDAPAADRRAYNIAGMEPLTLRHLVEAVVKAAGLRRLILPIPAAPVRAAIAALRRMGVPTALTAEQIDRIHEDKSFGFADAARELGFSPRSFSEGVKAELAMIREARTRAEVC